MIWACAIEKPTSISKEFNDYVILHCTVTSLFWNLVTKSWSQKKPKALIKLVWSVSAGCSKDKLLKAWAAKWKIKSGFSFWTSRNTRQGSVSSAMIIFALDWNAATFRRLLLGRTTPCTSYPRSRSASATWLPNMPEMPVTSAIFPLPRASWVPIFIKFLMWMISTPPRFVDVLCGSV